MEADQRVDETTNLFEKWQDAEETYRAVTLVGTEEEIVAALDVAIEAYTAYQAVRRPGGGEPL